MKTILLAAGVAAIALSGAQALAAAKHGAMVAEPKQPIPYAELNAYLKASPKQRASKDWWSGQSLASTGASANASATSSAGTDVRATPDATTASPSSSTSSATTPPTATPPASTSPSETAPTTNPANPPASTTPEAQPSSIPPK